MNKPNAELFLFILHPSSFIIFFRLSLLGVLLTMPAFVRAQYQIESWTTDDGLPQNTVSSIVQTRATVICGWRRSTVWCGMTA